jgi:hypothetical protein
MSHHLSAELVFSYPEVVEALRLGLGQLSGIAPGRSWSRLELQANGFTMSLEGGLMWNEGLVEGSLTRLFVSHEGDAAALKGELSLSGNPDAPLSGTATSFAWGDYDPATAEFSNVKTVSNFSLDMAQVDRIGFELLMEANTAVTASEGDDDFAGTDAADVVYSGSGADTLKGGEGDDILYGEAGDDFLYGGRGNDELYGGTGADYMEGGSGADKYFVDDAGDRVVETDNNPEESTADRVLLALDIGSTIDKVFSSIDFALTAFVENLDLTDNAISGTGNALDNLIGGNEGNNILTGGAGNDTLDGGAGIDTAVFGGNRADYAISVSAAGLGLSGPDGADSLSHIERLQFSDTKLAYDLSPGQHADMTLSFINVLAPALISDAATRGLILGFFDQGHSLGSLFQLAMERGLVTSLAGDDSPEALAQLVYRNLIGSPADAATTAMLVGYMDGTLDDLSPADFLLAVAGLNIHQPEIEVLMTGMQEMGMAYL